MADDNDSLGTDIACVNDLAPVWGLVSGRANLGQAVARRYGTPRGGLAYDDTYGNDLRNLVNADLTAAELSAARAGAAAEPLKDPRVQACAPTLDTSRPGIVLANLALEDDVGPFDLVLAANKVTVDLLGGAISTPAAIPENEPQPIFVPGPAGPPGQPGRDGASGGGISLPQPDLLVSTGAEIVLCQELTPLDSLPSTLTTVFSALIRVASGTGTFRVRIGGTQDNADGTVTATLSTSSATFVPASSTVAISNPGGLQLVKVTGQSATPGQDAAIRGRTLSIR